MANLTTIDSNQLVKQHHIGEENITESRIGCSPAVRTMMMAEAQIVVETLEQQLLIELNSGDKTDMIVRKNKNERQWENMEFRQIELIYRAEGNANLVLALPQFKKVLRLPKSQKPMIEQQQKQQKHQELTMQDFVAYMEIIRQIIGEAYVLDAKIVSIPKESDRNWINEQIRPHRPVHRLNKEFHGHFGLLLPDATLLPVALEVLLTDLHPTAAILEGADVYAIEIKTKQGWLLPSDVNDLFHITPTTFLSDTTTSSVCGSSYPDNTAGASGEAFNKLDTRCRYCVMQFLKLKQGKIDRMSKYCPMDLFSGNAIRMLKALDALFECPQNNLRLYRNGRLIYGDHANTMSCQHLREQLSSRKMELGQLKQLLMVSLLRDNGNKSDKTGVVGTDVVNAVVDSHVGQVEETIMIKSEVMVGKEEVMAGITETEMTQAKAQQQQINEAETQCLPKNCVLQQIVHLQLLAKHNLGHMSENGYLAKTERTYGTLEQLLNRHPKPTNINLDNLNASEKYMLGATALDCSIIIALQEIQSKSGMFGPNILELAATGDTGPRYFLNKVSIIDLDPKPDSHFHKYFKQTKEAIATATHEMTGCCAKDPSD